METQAHDSHGLIQSVGIISSIVGLPFEWCPITGGKVRLEDAHQENGTSGGEFHVADFWMAKYSVTNAQYQAFIDDPEGFGNVRWWEFSPQACRWHLDHPRSKATAFGGDLLPRTRVSWFDSMAFCAWLSAKFSQSTLQITPGVIRLPTEQEWQRAAVGDTDWEYPWGNEINSRYSNYGNRFGHPTPVDQFGEGKNPYGVMNMIGNVWEWCLTAWGKDFVDLNGYTYRAMRGGAWNINNLTYLRARGRYGHPPRAQLNDGGFRIACVNAVQ